MNIVFGFSLLFGVIAIVYYFISTNTINKSIDRYNISTDDIILVEYANENTMAIMWNSQSTNLEKILYRYSIKNQKDGKLIAVGSSGSVNGIHKVKGIPLVKGDTYIVTIESIRNSTTIGQTTITVPFFPITISNHKIHNNELDITTNITPTNLQIYLKNGRLLPNSQSNIKIEPPGITTQVAGLDTEELVVLLYNGKNAGTLWVFNPSSTSIL